MIATKISVPFENQSLLVQKKSSECQQIIEEEEENWKTNPLNETRCPTNWDRLFCWPSTAAGETAVYKCPDYIDNFFTEGYASRKCELNGKWYKNATTQKPWSNYTGCRSPSIPEYYFFIDHLKVVVSTGYTLSLVALVIAIFIMTKFKKLRCSRNTLHLNLFASFVFRAVMALIKSIVFQEGSSSSLHRQFMFDSIMENSLVTTWQCKLLTVVFNYAMVSNYSWIFVEGMYLHTLLFVVVFSETSGVFGFVVFGWVFPIFCVIPWVIVRATLENTTCWIINLTPAYAWVIKGPLLLTVVLNLFFFINVMRVLFTKLQSTGVRDTRKYRYIKLAKSSLVLIPLFGVPYVIFLALQENINKTVEIIKIYFEMIFNSFNGFIVACLYCFFNGEVQTELTKRWRRYRMGFKRRGFHISGTRRSTNTGLTKCNHSRREVNQSESYYDSTAMQFEPAREDMGKNAKGNEERSRMIELLEITNKSCVESSCDTLDECGDADGRNDRSVVDEGKAENRDESCADDEENDGFEEDNFEGNHNIKDGDKKDNKINNSTDSKYHNNKNYNHNGLGAPASKNITSSSISIVTTAAKGHKSKPTTYEGPYTIA